MPCIKLDPGTLVDVRSLQQAATSLSLFKGPIPQTVFPKGSLAKDFPYLTGPDSLTFNIEPLYNNGEAGLNCVLSGLGYNPDRALQIADEVSNIGSDEEYQAYLQSLPASDALTYDTYKTLGVVKYFRTDASPKDISVGGNTDAQQNHVTTSELDSWAWEASGHDVEQFNSVGGDVVAHFHALERLGIYFNTEKPTEPQTTTYTDAGVPTNAAKNLDAGVDGSIAGAEQHSDSIGLGQIANVGVVLVGAAVLVALGRVWGQRSMRSTVALASGASAAASKGPQAAVKAQMITSSLPAPAPAVAAPTSSPAIQAAIAQIGAGPDDQGSPGGTS